MTELLQLFQLEGLLDDGNVAHMIKERGLNKPVVKYWFERAMSVITSPNPKGEPLTDWDMMIYDFAVRENDPNLSSYLLPFIQCIGMVELHAGRAICSAAEQHRDLQKFNTTEWTDFATFQYRLHDDHTYRLVLTVSQEGLLNRSNNFVEYRRDLIKGILGRRS